MKWRTAIIVTSIFLLLLSGCAPEPAIAYDDILPCTIQVKGIHYSFWEVIELETEPEIAGYITEYEVPIIQMPTKDDAANFDCVGCPYAFVEGELVLRYKGDWILCNRVDPPEGTEAN